MRARRYGSNRGNAMVVSVLLLLSLSSVGVISISRTRAELSLTGNVVRAGAATLAAEAATMKTLADFRSDLQNKLGEFQKQGNRYLPAVEAHTTALDPSDSRGFPIVKPSDAALEQQAAMMQAMAFSVGALGGGAMSQICDVPGNEVGKICFALFDFEVFGMVPENMGETPDETRNKPVVKSRYRSRAVLGPWKPLYGGKQ